MKPKLMILGDSPTRETGFARVVRNLLNEWLKADVFGEIHVWGIGYWGFPHDFPSHVKIYPAAGPQNQDWAHVENLKRFAHIMANGDFTHCWLLQDVWGLTALGQLLRRLAKDEGLKTLLYFPVDAPLEREWMEIVASVQVPVAYCEYGKQEALTALKIETGEREDDQRAKAAMSRLRVIPHGVDECFCPKDDPEQRAEMRARLTGGKIADNDLLLVNVATHQRRKGLAQSLQIFNHLAGLAHANGIKRRVFLYLHCEPINHTEGSSLPLMASQLGLLGDIGETLFFGSESYFVNGRPCATDEAMNRIYGAADCLLSTSLGEGWGLPLTEAMAAGTLVAAPNHTSCAEILGGRGETLRNGGIASDRGVLLPTLTQADMVIGDNSRLRHRVDAEEAANLIYCALEEDEEWRERLRVNAMRWVKQPERSWPVIARQWLQLMEVR